MASAPQSSAPPSDRRFLPLLIAAFLLALPYETSAQAEDCMECSLRENVVILNKGYLCSELADECHNHDDRAIGPEKFWLAGHPTRVWLDDACHNLCSTEPGGSGESISAMDLAYRSIWVERRPVDDTIGDLKRRGFVLDRHSSGGYLMISLRCGSTVRLPVPEGMRQPAARGLQP